MRYLVQMESVDGGDAMPPKQVAAMIEDMVVPTLKIILEWQKAGKATGGILTGRRGGVFIIDADSHEELNDMLQSLPLWGISEVDVTPLDSIEHRIEFEGGLVPMLKQM